MTKYNYIFTIATRDRDGAIWWYWVSKMLVLDNNNLITYFPMFAFVDTKSKNIFEPPVGCLFQGY